MSPTRPSIGLPRAGASPSTLPVGHDATRQLILETMVGGEVPWSTHDGIWIEYGWDMVSMVMEGFDLKGMVVRTTIREQSVSHAS